MYYFFLLGVILFMINCAGTRPTNLGVKDGKLLQCPTTPNCVASQIEKTDSHFIEPYKYKTELSEAFKQLKGIIEKQERAKIISESDLYINAEFKSKLMGFVDDVEFYFDDTNKTVHVRSASRLGKSDLNVNRKRIESIREQLNW
jgi:uncharacterized protein (DUF1499 family)